MNVKEFSYEFDIMYNNISSNVAPGFNEYEKSLLLTTAQEEILKNYFNKNGNKYNEGFDNSEKRQIDFSNLIYVEKCNINNSTSVKIDNRSTSFKLPNNILFILNEIATIKKIKSPQEEEINTVVPINYNEYSRILLKPYKEPLKGQTWRLISNIDSTNKVADLIPKTSYIVDEYKIRYVKKPNPIILVNLNTISPLLSIDGKNVVSECELDSEIHREILARAVELAKIHYQGNPGDILEINTRKE